MADMKTEVKKVIISILAAIGIITLGVVGYEIIEGWSLLDALYMTLITVTTVGYGEVHPLSEEGRIFTLVILFLGVALVLYVFSMVTEAIVSGQIQKAMGLRRLEKKIAKLKGHYIVCGFGRIGQVITEMVSKEHPVVVIENDPVQIARLEEGGYLYIEGDATSEETLIRAGVERARGLFSVLQSDADNVYIILTAKGINPDIFLIARAAEEDAEKKLLRAGADRVVSPYVIGARRMALTVLRPTVTDFLELAVHKASFDLQIEEVTVLEGSKLVGRNLLESGIRQKTGAIILAIKKQTGQMAYNPSPDYLIDPGDILIALADQKGLSRLKELAHTESG
ncbi:potassium channel family protein [Thermosulfuriphilus sp.]